MFSNHSPGPIDTQGIFEPREGSVLNCLRTSWPGSLGLLFMSKGETRRSKGESTLACIALTRVPRQELCMSDQLTEHQSRRKKAQSLTLLHIHFCKATRKRLSYSAHLRELALGRPVLAGTAKHKVPAGSFYGCLLVAWIRRPWCAAACRRWHGEECSTPPRMRP